MLAASLDFSARLVCLVEDWLNHTAYTLPIQFIVAPLLWLKAASPCSSRTKTGQTDTTRGCVWVSVFGKFWLRNKFRTSLFFSSTHTLDQLNMRCVYFLLTAMRQCWWNKSGKVEPLADMSGRFARQSVSRHFYCHHRCLSDRRHFTSAIQVFSRSSQQGSHAPPAALNTLWKCIFKNTGLLCHRIIGFIRQKCLLALTSR